MQGQGVKVFQEPQEDNSVIGFILSNLLILGLTFFLPKPSDAQDG